MSILIVEPCRHCGHKGPHTVTIMESGVHYAKVTCSSPTCRRLMKWLPKPQDDPTKYRRPASHHELVEKYGKGFCEMCLRRKEDFPKGTTLIGHHVVEYEAGQGSSERENIWILCTACHQMVHWVRTYHGGDPREMVKLLAEGFEKWKA